ncbi:DUF362 domain-containing protein [Polyangium mundeleinium]|uniref:DUF362 domain-containing protein n=1 Tax=Polyangium mundeleinium TaxID=2995306 RepID=A0ABT5ENR2_9BACT|nr:DUF362 domain-containing protein [Polyangium mundeleinium]MDC0742361.1 DUF362 domain-containing protein [Polyangium mundeleinium]
MTQASSVAIVSRPGTTYAAGGVPPFDPPNPVYAMVEALFRELGLDAARAGTPEWSPLGDLIRPGDRVIVKPNLVSSKNLHEKITGEKLWASSTHGALLRPILDHALRAAGPRGSVRVVDSPVEGCEIEKVAGPLGIFAVIDHLRRGGADVDFVDLRYFRVAPYFALDDVRRGGLSYNLGMLVRTRLPGDPRGYRVVDLGDRSAFARSEAPPGERLRFHRSHYETPVPHHTGGKHEYSLPCTVLDADVVINLPKMKTHKKTGVTLALKSVIGFTNEKYWLPHFTAGDPSVGGDEFDRPRSLAERIEDKLSRFPLPGDHSLVMRLARVGAPSKVIDGSWEGNDTLWRTILDLNRILFFVDRDGIWRDEPVRRYLALVDGIVAGEGEGPLGATPICAGTLVGGFDPGIVDATAAEEMGFDPARMAMIREALGMVSRAHLAGRIVRRDGPRFERKFRAPRSWPSLG